MKMEDKGRNKGGRERWEGEREGEKVKRPQDNEQVQGAPDRLSYTLTPHRQSTLPNHSVRRTRKTQSLCIHQSPPQHQLSYDKCDLLA
jgi:hypothetical protein